MAALAAAERAAAQGEVAQARDWLERARRLAPRDLTVALLLGLHWLRHAPARAEPLLTEVAAGAEIGEAWLGLAAIRQGAARRAALVHYLRHFSLPDDLAQIRQLAEGQPWCGVQRDAAGGLFGVRSTGSRRPLHPTARAFTVRGALGSPIRLERFRAAEACVWQQAEGLAGWAWHPASPDITAPLTASDALGHRLEIHPTQNTTSPAPLSRARGFALDAAALVGWGQVIRITDASGRDIPGSPLDRAAERRVITAPARFPPPTPADAARRVAVMVPVYRHRSLTLACLRALFATAPEAAVIVVDDASPEPALAADLDRLAQSGRITLIRHEANRGFPVSANAGLRAALALPEPHDVVLLNADAIVPHGREASWLDRLRAVVHADGRIGSATPLSNNASLMSYPARDGGNPAPDRRELRQLDAMAARANAGVAVEIPTGVGFCLYLRHEMLRDVGLLREDLFAQGYGEENDLCRRASARGWRHVGCPGVVVAHHGAASFGPARTALMARNLAVLGRVHPGYGDLVSAWAGRDPVEDALAPARRRLDEVRFGSFGPTTLIITHASGGGVERSVQQRVVQLGERAILLRPVPVPGDDDGAHFPGLCRVEDAARSAEFPNLFYRLPDEFPALLRLLRRASPVAVEMHHRLGHAPEIAELARRLKLPLDIVLHDCASFCPRVTLLGPQGRYCGEPTDIATCIACIAEAGPRNGEAIGVAELRQRSTREFATAHQVRVPSDDMARRMRRHFPALAPHVDPPEADAHIAPPPALRAGGEVVVAVIGALGVDKGLDVLLACAEDAAARNLPLRFCLIGHSERDAALIATGRVFITGRYSEAEAEALIRAQGAQLAFLPSVIPESWGYTLSLAWRAGLRTAVFDLGAQAARVRRSLYGWVLPLGLPPDMINTSLLACANP